MSPRPGRALVIGGSGFLGSRLLALAPPDVVLSGTGWRRPLLPGDWRGYSADLRSPSAVRSILEREHPHAVFFSAYDRSDPQVTVDAPVAAAAAAAAVGARFIFVSTDLVFDGVKGGYTEDDVAAPILTYGRMKLAAEAGVRLENAEALVLRPSLLVGESGALERPLFEREHLAQGREVDLFEDEWRSPVHVDDVARAAWHFVSTEIAGLVHVGGPERLSRLELGEALAAMYGYDRGLIRKARRPADRPRDTSLNSARAAGLLGWSPRTLLASGAPAARTGAR